MAAYLAFAAGEAVSLQGADPEQSTTQATIDGVTIKLGSIHSVKGGEQWTQS